LVPVDDGAYGPDLAKKTTTMRLKQTRKVEDVGKSLPAQATALAGTRGKMEWEREVVEDERFGGKRIEKGGRVGDEI
jgi:hypothetical protein